MRLGARGPSLAAVLLTVVCLVASLRGCGASSAGTGEPPAVAGPVRAPVTRVVDGDTIEVSLGGAREYVRYIGVDTPETVDPDEPVGCFGHRASAFNESLVAGRSVRLEFDVERRDAYGRLLAYVHVGGVFVNAELVKRGYARTLAIAPNVSHARQFERLEGHAGRHGRGLWGACSG